MKIDRAGVLPCFYFPTTVFLVDDNPRFLDALCLDLGESILTQAYHNPHDALAALETCPTLPANAFAYNSEPVSDNAEPIEFDIAAIHSLLYRRPIRFESVTTVVVDYAMPPLDGLRFCKNMAAGFKKIMLTGEADDRIAVDAFNQGAIDQFVLKAGRDCNDRLKQYIEQAQYQQFLAHTELLLQSLSGDTHMPLKDAGFIQFFQSLCAKYAIVEFYLLDSSGSFLLLNDKAEPIELVTKTASDIQWLTELLESDTTLSADQAQSIRRGAMIPYFVNQKAAIQPAQAWSLLPAQRVEGKGTAFYCAVLEGEAIKRSLSSVVSYRDFLSGSV